MQGLRKTYPAQLLYYIMLLLLTGTSFLIPTQGRADLSTTDTIELYGSPNPVGSGARALGMGGAFIALADDATAASWNPGGLIQLELPEISVVGAYFDRSLDTEFTDFPEARNEQHASDTSINYLSFSYPFYALGRNMTVSFNYQELYNFDNQWSFHVIENNDTTTRQINGWQEGSLSAFGLALCAEVYRNLSFGLTLNFWQDGMGHENQWEQRTRKNSSGVNGSYSFTQSEYYTDRYEFSGFNANLGFLWNITPKLTMGGVLKTPFTADLTHKAHYTTQLEFPGYPDSTSTMDYSSSTDEKLDMPMSYGIGIAWRASDRLTVSGDLYRTEWEDFLLTDGNGKKTSPITGKSKGDSDIDPTHQVRLGVEYLLIKPKYVIPLRSGVFYDPAPAEGHPDNYFGLSLGSGLAYKKFIFDFAIQYRFGNDVGAYASQDLDYSQDVQEIIVYSSFIIHF